MHELERRLRVTEPVIKFLTVRVDEEQKRLDKIKKIRDAKIPYRGKNKPQSQKEANRAHARLRAPGERANAQLKT